jgi:hypothetical protein
MLVVLMQYVIATKAGLVNAVQGMVNVKTTQMVPAGSPIRTGPNGFVEVLLTPGSFLRLGPNSEATLEQVELTGVTVSVTAGTTIIEAVEVNNPIRVKTGNLTMEVADPGIYKFADGQATVIEGKLQTADAKASYKKGWQVSYNATYRGRKVSDTAATELDTFSQKRSELMARANANLVASSLAPELRMTGLRLGSPFWLYYPSFGASVYLPLRSYRSPYGYRFGGIGAPNYGGNGQANGEASAADASSRNNTNPSNSNPNVPSGGMGAGSSAPSNPTFSVPAGEPTSRGEYIQRKAGSAPAAPPPQN